MHLTLSALIILMVCCSCTKTNQEQPLTVSIIKEVSIKIDLEDQIFRLNGEGDWHNMDSDMENCSPLFLIGYSYSNREIQIKNCESEGEIMYDSITIESEYCTTNILNHYSVTESGIISSSLQVSDEFNICLFEEDDIFTLNILFNSYE